MYSLAARFRKSRQEGAQGSVYYVIRSNGTDRRERNITSDIRGRDEGVILENRDRIAFDLMTLYCVIEKLAEAGEACPDVIAARGREVLEGVNPFAERISAYQGRYPVDREVATVAKVFADKFEAKARPDNVPDVSSLFGYLNHLINNYSASGKPYVRSLRSLYGSLRGFSPEDFLLRDLDGGFISAYSRYLSGRVAADTAAFYLRVLRNVVNKATGDGLIPDGFRWPHDVDTRSRRPEEEPTDNALDPTTLRRLTEMDLSAEPNLELARDSFLFALYARGMELIDVANLRSGNLNGSTLSYRRRLKGRLETVRLGDKAMALIRKYSRADSDYLFPILQRRWVRTFRSASEEIAQSLKEIGQRLGLPDRLTFSRNRHTRQALERSAEIVDLLLP